MGIQLRPYQNDAVQAINAGWGRGVFRLLFTMPTGTGKTTVFGEVVRQLHRTGAVSASRPAIVLAHRDELIEQASERLGSMAPGLAVGVEQSGRRAPAGVAVVVASVQTLGRSPNRLSNCHPSLVIVDEAHHSLAENSYGAVLRRFGAFQGRCRVLGCTATPNRLDRKALHTEDDTLFEEIAYSYPIRDAMKDGWLCDIRGYRVKSEINLDTIRGSGEDFEAADLALCVDNDTRTRSVIRHWLEVANGRRTIVFCAGVRHAENAARLWQEEADVRVAAVHGGMDREERSSVMQRFRSGGIQVLTNCQVATEGLDVPAVSAIVMLRPTKSWSLYVQCVGRGTRPAPGKPDLVVIDVADNCMRHSLASVPAILDLPPGLDLEGQTLLSAAELLDRLTGEQSAAVNAMRPQTLGELQTILERVDLLATIESPPDVRQCSDLTWLACADGGFFLACGSCRDARITVDALRHHWLVLRKGPSPNRQTSRMMRLGPDLARAFDVADRKILEIWPDARQLVSANAQWRGRGPSQKQLSRLRALGVNPDAIPDLTSGKASALISQRLEVWR